MSAKSVRGRSLGSSRARAFHKITAHNDTIVPAPAFFRAQCSMNARKPKPKPKPKIARDDRWQSGAVSIMPYSFWNGLNFRDSKRTSCCSSVGGEGLAQAPLA